ncbi:MAG: hypothetical protein K5929_00325 [Lachnospiraceae bacterium]|nr:hypothetical protein [Lachnospiraceae bacterium]
MTANTYKSNMRSQLLLYAVTDSRWAGEDGLIAQVEAAIEGRCPYRQMNLQEL